MLRKKRRGNEGREQRREREKEREKKKRKMRRLADAKGLEGGSV